MSVDADAAPNGNADESSTGPELAIAAESTADGEAVCPTVPPESHGWRCPTCMVHATGSAIESSLVSDDVSEGQEARPIRC